MTTSEFLLFLTLLSFLSSLFYYTLLDQKLHLQKYHADVPQRNINVLLWHWPFGRSYTLDGNKCLQMYNIGHCSLSDNTSDLSSADVVVFHHHELSYSLSALPLNVDRPVSQHWVWMSMEPPINNENLMQLNGLFNWTMTYRRDADIPIPYGKTIRGEDNSSFQIPAPNRSCLISWVVSKYNPDQARAHVYQSLKKYIPINVYGSWNKRPLTDKNLLPTIAKCVFYLSFENSQTKDYITEKLWRNAFQAGAIPVVLGPSRATYEALAPPGSFIHVEDFKSIAQLAAYLKHVAADRQAYEQYFEWRHTHRIKTYTDWRERLCQICVKYPSLPANRVYHDLESWVNC